MIRIMNVNPLQNTKVHFALLHANYVGEGQQVNNQTTAFKTTIAKILQISLARHFLRLFRVLMSVRGGGGGP